MAGSNIYESYYQPTSPVSDEATRKLIDEYNNIVDKINAHRKQYGYTPTTTMQTHGLEKQKQDIWSKIYQATKAEEDKRRLEQIKQEDKARQDYMKEVSERAPFPQRVRNRVRDWWNGAQNELQREADSMYAQNQANKEKHLAELNEYMYTRDENKIKQAQQTVDNFYKMPGNRYLYHYGSTLPTTVKEAEALLKKDKEFLKEWNSGNKGWKNKQNVQTRAGFDRYSYDVINSQNLDVTDCMYKLAKEWYSGDMQKWIDQYYGTDTDSKLSAALSGTARTNSDLIKRTQLKDLLKSFPSPKQDITHNVETYYTILVYRDWINHTLQSGVVQKNGHLYTDDRGLSDLSTFSTHLKETIPAALNEIRSALNSYYNGNDEYPGWKEVLQLINTGGHEMNEGLTEEPSRSTGIRYAQPSTPQNRSTSEYSNASKPQQVLDVANRSQQGGK